MPICNTYPDKFQNVWSSRWQFVWIDSQWNHNSKTAHYCASVSVMLSCQCAQMFLHRMCTWLAWPALVRQCTLGYSLCLHFDNSIHLSVAVFAGLEILSQTAFVHIPAWYRQLQYTAGFLKCKNLANTQICKDSDTLHILRQVQLTSTF
jgi:hypothetical protein